MAELIWEIVDVQVLASEQCLNVFHFLDADGSHTITDLLDSLIADYIPGVAVFQSDDLQHTQLLYRQVYPTQQLQHNYSVGLPVSGQISASSALANAFALSVQWNIGPTTTLVGGTLPYIKRGGARLAGATEGDVDGNAIAGSTGADWAAAFIDLQLPSGGDYSLIVASYLNGARARQHTVQAYAPVIGSSAPAPSTQNTRKILRGRIS